MKVELLYCYLASREITTATFISKWSLYRRCIHHTFMRYPMLAIHLSNKSNLYHSFALNYLYVIKQPACLILLNWRMCRIYSVYMLTYLLTGDLLGDTSNYGNAFTIQRNASWIGFVQNLFIEDKVLKSNVPEMILNVLKFW